MDAIRSKHADCYYLPDYTRNDTSANSSNQKIKLLEEVTIDDSEQTQQTISPILNLDGGGLAEEVAVEVVDAATI
jgi:hypothetical protein